MYEEGEDYEFFGYCSRCGDYGEFADFEGNDSIEGKQCFSCYKPSKKELQNNNGCYVFHSNRDDHFNNLY